MFQNYNNFWLADLINVFKGKGFIAVISYFSELKFSTFFGACKLDGCSKQLKRYGFVNQIKLLTVFSTRLI